MFDSILQLDIVKEILFNTILVSIPEEIYLVIFTLILVGEFEYWKEPECKKIFYSYDYSRILIPAVSVALLSNVFRYSEFSSGFTTLITILVLYILIILTNDIFGDASALKWMGKTFLFLILGFMTIGISELLYLPLILYGTGITIEEINNDILLNFLISIPSKIILYSLLIYLAIKKRTVLKRNIFKLIFVNPTLLILTLLIVTINLFFLWIFYKIIIFDKLLISFSSIIQLIIIIGVIIFPIINILSFTYSIYYIKNKEMNNKKILKEKLQDVSSNLTLYTNNDDWTNINWKLNEIGLGIEDITSVLCTDNDNFNKT